MEQRDNSLRSSATTSESNNSFEEHRERLIFVHAKRAHIYLTKVTGKNQNRDCWHLVLTDLGKKEELLEIDGENIDAKDYGKILASGWGHDMPESASNKARKFVKDLENQLFIFRLQANKEIFYVLCDADKKSEIAASRTAEEVECCGRVLYSSMDEEPPEALWDVIEKGYFGSSEESNLVTLSEKGTESSRRGYEIGRRADILEVRHFLEEMGNVDWTDKNGWTMLHHAAYCGDLNMIRILKDMKANTQLRDNICGRKPIHIAARECHARAIELFLIDSDSVNDTDKSGWTPLHYAAWKGESSVVKYLISKNADSDIRDRHIGKKPIHVAVTEGHMDIVQIFLDNGAEIDDVDAEGRTLLYHAAFAGRSEMAKFFIDRNANMDIANKFGMKPIHVSSNADRPELVKLLLSYGSDIESRDLVGNRPLHLGITCGFMKVVQLLVEKGANLSATNEEGKTPFDLAVKWEHLEIASYLAEKLCGIFQDEAKCNDALEIFDKLFKIQKEKLGGGDCKTLKTQNNIASLLYELGKYEEALVHFNVVLNKNEVSSGACYLDTLSTKYEIGRVYVAQWKLDEAMDIFKDIYKSWQNELGADHPRTLSVAREIAFVHFRKCEYDKAFKVFEDIYEKRKKLSPGVNDPVTLQALEDVAIVLINQGENKNALCVLKDIFAKRKVCLGANHPETLSVGYHIAEVEKRLVNTKEEGSCCLQ